MRFSLWPMAMTVVLCATLNARVTQTSSSATSMTAQEKMLRQPLARDSEFSAVLHISSRPDCEDVEPPQAIATPDPLWKPNHQRPRVEVSFIVGTDGRVHSPLILESAGMSGDQRVLLAIKTWRFRPATCNGVPTETEGRVSFSSR